MTNNDKDRERFEKWIVSHCAPLLKRDELLPRSKDGLYTLFTIQESWEAWQAALATVSTAQPVEGQDISIDVSTGDHDAGNRIFAKLTGDTNGGTWIAIEDSRNFAQPVAWLVNTVEPKAGYPFATSHLDVVRQCTEGLHIVTPLYAGPVSTAPSEAENERAEEDAYVINRLAQILAGIAIAFKGEELQRHRHGYHDLVEIAQAKCLEIELLKMQAAEIRNRALEEAAKQCELIASRITGLNPAATAAKVCAESIRALQTAAPQDKESGNG